MRDGNPANSQNWKLVCSVCGAEWEDAETVGLASGHFAEDHPELDNPSFTTVWVGKGPRPKSGPQLHPGTGKRRRRR